MTGCNEAFWSIKGANEKAHPIYGPLQYTGDLSAQIRGRGMPQKGAC